MIRQGLLVFADGRRQLNIRVAGLSLLERGIRTMARAGIKSYRFSFPMVRPLPSAALSKTST